MFQKPPSFPHTGSQRTFWGEVGTFTQELGNIPVGTGVEVRPSLWLLSGGQAGTVLPQALTGTGTGDANGENAGTGPGAPSGWEALAACAGLGGGSAETPASVQASALWEHWCHAPCQGVLVRWAGAHLSRRHRRRSLPQTAGTLASETQCAVFFLFSGSPGAKV